MCIVYKRGSVLKVNAYRCSRTSDRFIEKTITEYQQGIGYILKFIVDGNVEQWRVDDTQIFGTFYGVV